MDPTQRFWGKVERTPGCWLWRGSTQQGYGVLRGDGKSRGKGGQARIVLVHRLCWEMHFGSIPEGKVVCHRCDVRNCVNPAHLFIGSPIDNNTDMLAKDRQARGERAATARMTEADVREARRRFAAGMTQAQLARFYGVTPQGMASILQRKTWKHVA